MRTTSSALVALFAVSSALAQTLPPSPTASVGCEPHGDHWHCDGPATATIATVTTSAATTSSAHDDEEESGTLPPSPTESVGCEPHGDHWHCDGPASTTSAAPATTTTHDYDDEEDDDEGTGTLPPSPTASVGCEPHGDHWHCDGPAVTSSSTVATSIVATSATASTAAPVSTGGVDKLLTNGGVLAGGLLLALGL
ncbi:hypothetical protein GGR58DRAFT_507946 [Xylaria digitata]|nr:hypothetical protein GGR58DRAFT_507946 [Xylaria digitata]